MQDYSFEGAVTLPDEVCQFEVVDQLSEALNELSDSSNIRVLRVAKITERSVPSEAVCKALTTRILAVAVPDAVGQWAVYMDAVPGNNHKEEMAEVVRSGSKQSKKMGVFLFPDFEPSLYRE